MYGKKEMKLSKVTNSALFQLAFTSGGELPKSLSGRYTSADLAVKAVHAAEVMRVNDSKKTITAQKK